jgi:hypothetical protein
LEYVFSVCFLSCLMTLMAMRVFLLSRYSLRITDFDLRQSVNISDLYVNHKKKIRGQVLRAAAQQSFVDWVIG